MIRVFSAGLRSCRNRLILGSAGATPLGCELPINFLNRKDLGIEIAADLVSAASPRLIQLAGKFNF
jgi:hypothetical protein